MRLRLASADIANTEAPLEAGARYPGPMRSPQIKIEASDVASVPSGGV